MKCEIITGRSYVEKMAEDVFLCNDKVLVPVDYADLQALRRMGTFKKAIIFDIDAQEGKWTDEFIGNIESQQLPLASLRAFMLNIIASEDDSLLYSDVIELWQYLTRIKHRGGNSNDTFDDYVECLWSVRIRPSMPKGALKIELLASYEKMEQDKPEDERFEQMIEEYRTSFCLPMDFPEFVMTPDDKEGTQNL